MKIAMVCPYSISTHGGVQDQVLSLARTMRAMGKDVRVLAPCDHPPPEAGITTLGPSLPTAANGSVAPIAPGVSTQLRLLATYFEQRFDIIHLHEPLAPGVGITTVLTRPAPILATFHAAGRSSSYKYFNRAVRFLRNRIDLACTVSDDAEALASKYLGGNYVPMFNGIEIERYRKVEHNSTNTAAAAELGREPVLLFLGRHEERKGLTVLLESLSYLPKKLDRTRIWVAGEGEETLALKKRYASDKRIQWLGPISDKEKYLRLANASALVAPSLRGESFGLVLLEAMAAQTPAIASDIDGYREVAQNGESAALFEAGNPRELAKTVTRVLTDKDEQKQLTEAGNSRVEQFSMKRLAEQYLSLYESLG